MSSLSYFFSHLHVSGPVVGPYMYLHPNRLYVSIGKYIGRTSLFEEKKQALERGICIMVILPSSWGWVSSSWITKKYISKGLE